MASAMRDLCKTAELAENTLAVLRSTFSVFSVCSVDPKILAGLCVATFANALPPSHRATNN